MKAVLLRGYGDVDQLDYTDAPDPKPGPGEVLIRVDSTDVNPVDWKIRSGMLKDVMPVQLPAILGRDVAGEVVELGPGVSAFKKGDRVLGLVQRSYAEYVTAKAEDLALIPDGMKSEDAGVLPLVLLTGAQLVERGVKPQAGERILVTGAVGAVGRSAVYVAAQHGARVIAGVRSHQVKEAEALKVDQVLAIDSDEAIRQLPELDAIADTVNGPTIQKLLPHLRKGGRLGSVLGKPEGAEEKGIEVNAVFAQPDSTRLGELAQASFNGELDIPISLRLPLSEIREAHRRAEQGVNGKILLIP